MKYIFSRKGFDSSAGGYPSPIFPDGTLFSIPIPSNNDKDTYGQLNFKYHNQRIETILRDLTNNSINKDSTCHHDPRLLFDKYRERLTLGQANQAEGHLRNQNVGEGDIFLFYGWFRKVDKRDGIWIYKPDAEDLHVIWSYMEVESTTYFDTNELQKETLKTHPYLKAHPHCGKQDGSKNRIYISKQHEFFDFRLDRCLTDIENYAGRSTWRLPACLHQPHAFTYLNNFSRDGTSTVVKFKGYGQEFVLDMDKVELSSDRASITNYINDLIH